MPALGHFPGNDILGSCLPRKPHRWRACGRHCPSGGKIHLSSGWWRRRRRKTSQAKATTAVLATLANDADRGVRKTVARALARDIRAIPKASDSDAPAAGVGGTGADCCLAAAPINRAPTLPDGAGAYYRTVGSPAIRPAISSARAVARVAVHSTARSLRLRTVVRSALPICMSSAVVSI